MKIDKENDGVAFNDSTHVYWDINKDRSEFGLKVGFGFYF